MTDYAIFIPIGKKGEVMTVEEIANTASRFISELENGKATCQIGKVLKVISCLGIKVELKAASQSKAIL
jgi:hypothetical protein